MGGSVVPSSGELSGPSRPGRLLDPSRRSAGRAGPRLELAGEQRRSEGHVVADAERRVPGPYPGGPAASVVQGVPGNVRQPAGTEQARRVALDGQGGQRREPSSSPVCTSRADRRPSATANPRYTPPAAASVAADSSRACWRGSASATASVASPRTAPASSAAPVPGPSSCRGASVRCRTDRILLIGPPPRLDCVIRRPGTLRRSAQKTQAPHDRGHIPAGIFG